MTLVAERPAPAVERCPAKPEGGHSWAVFEQGIGCTLCPAWRPRAPRAVIHVDPHPTGFVRLPRRRHS